MVRIPYQNDIRKEKVFRITQEQAGMARPYHGITCGAANQTILLKRDGII